MFLSSARVQLLVCLAVFALGIIPIDAQPPEPGTTPTPMLPVPYPWRPTTPAGQPVAPVGPPATSPYTYPWGPYLQQQQGPSQPVGPGWSYPQDYGPNNGNGYPVNPGQLNPGQNGYPAHQQPIYPYNGQPRPTYQENPLYPYPGQPGVNYPTYPGDSVNTTIPHPTYPVGENAIPPSGPYPGPTVNGVPGFSYPQNYPPNSGSFNYVNPGLPGYPYQPPTSGTPPLQPGQLDPLIIQQMENLPRARQPDTTFPTDIFEFPASPTRGKLLNALDRGLENRREYLDKRFPRYGEIFFLRSQDELTRSEEGVVPGDYILRSGDELHLTSYNVKGGESASELGIDQNGQAYMPGVGPVNLAGMTLAGAQQQLNSRIQTKLPNFRVKLSMTRIRKLRVFVLGEARRPGGLLVNPGSTLLDAVLASGGPTKTGSYRRIELQRNGRRLQNLDIYEVLLKGRTDSPRLFEGDRIWFPPTGPEVIVDGEVLRPAQYEILHERNQAQVIALAGGVKPTADRNQIHLIRMANNSSRRMRDIPLKQMDTVNVKNGDILTVQPLLADFANTVYIDGAVRRPGYYSVPKGMRVTDLIAKASGMRDGVYPGRAEIYRRNAPEVPVELISFDLGAALTGPASDASNPGIQSKDYVIIYGYSDSFVNTRQVRIAGEVGKPGDYARFQQMKLRDLLFQAGGLTPEAAEIVEVASRQPDGSLQRRSINVNTILADPKSSDNVALSDFDTVIVRKALRARRWPAHIIVSGEFKNPGIYTIDPERDSLTDVIRMAGGFTEKAYLRGAVFMRNRKDLIEPTQERLTKDVFELLQDIANRYALAEQSRQAKTGAALPVTGSTSALNTLTATGSATGVRSIQRVLATTRIPLSAQSLVEGGGADPGLRDGDQFYVPIEPKTLVVAGAVVVPSAILFEEGKDLDYYISRAGGFTDDAASDKLFVIGADGRIIRKDQIQRLERGDTIVTPPQAIVARPGGLEIFLSLAQSVLNYVTLGQVLRN